MMSASRIDQDPGLSLRSAALIAGFGLLVMVLTAPIANFYFISQSVDLSDMTQTVASLQTNPTPFLTGLVLLFITYTMDSLVAWGLYWYLRPGQTAFAQVMAWSRLVYAALAFVGLWSNLAAFELATSVPATALLSEPDMQAQVLALLVSAKSMEAMALAFFGVHLGLVSVLLWRSSHTPWWLSLPVASAGLSYIMLFVGSRLAPALELNWLLMVAAGELALMLWLLIVGWRVRPA